jgi:probable rRNA maturation factor
MQDSGSLEITNTTKGRLPSLPFVSIKEAILGKTYELSLSFVSPRMQKKLNSTYRGKDKTTNVLSFPLSETSGEITFDTAQVKKDAPNFDMPYDTFLKYLFIHGCLHLKGYEHGDTMEKEEGKFLKKFSHSHSSLSHGKGTSNMRYRYRHTRDKGRGNGL